MSDIEIIKEEGWTNLVLNRPTKLNALSRPLLAELLEALGDADADDSVSAVLISANGTDFCSGFDISQSYAGPSANDDPDLTKKLTSLESGREVQRAIWNFRKPIVAKVHGRCLAGGTELVFLCDMVLATSDATFAYPAVRDMGTPTMPMWLYYAGPQWARRLLFTGDSITGEDAAKIGLILKALPREQLDAEASGLMKRLAKIDWQLLANQKRINSTALELMGMHMLHKVAAMTDVVAWSSPTARRLGEAEPAEYVRILRDRREKLFGPGVVNVSGPDPFDDEGRLL